MIRLLYIYFKFEVTIDKIDNARTILNYLSDLLNELYFLFLKFILPAINNLNTLFRRESSQIHTLHASMTTLVRTILDYFVKPEYLKNTFSDAENVLNNEDMYLGVGEDLIFSELIASNKVTNEQLTQF